MTLIVALEGKDGLTLASDSRGTFGDPRGITAQNDSMQKLYKLSDYTGILISGAGELGVSLIDEVIKAIKAKSLIGVTPLAQEFSSIAKAKYAEWFTNFAFPNVQNADKPVRPTISVIIGGYDVDEQGKPIESEKKIFQSNSEYDFALMRSNYGFSVSGIPLFALYLFNRFYARDLSVEELLHLAVYSITETASQDGKVGGAIQALEITAKEAKELTKEEIEKIIESNNGRSTRLKKSFYHEGGGNHAGKETTRTAKK